MKPIKTFRKRKARKIRKGKGETEGKSTHLMEWGEDKSKRGKKVYTVNPTIAPTGKGGKYEPQSYKQAKDRGEVFEFKRQRKAEKFAHGSWKKGKDKRDAMKDFRQMMKKRKDEENEGKIKVVKHKRRPTKRKKTRRIITRKGRN